MNIKKKLVEKILESILAKMVKICIFLAKIINFEPFVPICWLWKLLVMALYMLGKFLSTFLFPTLTLFLVFALSGEPIIHCLVFDF